MIDPNSPAKYYSNATALQEAQEIISKCKINMLSTLQIQSSSFIKAIFPRLSFFNHSCIPNVKQVNFSDGSIIGVAATDIPKGASLFITYVGQQLPFSIRQKMLLNWKFCCRCKRCNDNIEGQLRLKQMEKEKNVKIEKDSEVEKQNEYKFPPDMFCEALVCECNNPLFRVYRNPQEVTTINNLEKINEPYYYLCPKCLTPRIQSEQEQTEIDNCIAQVDETQTDSSVHEFERHLKQIKKKFPSFHPLSCVSKIILTQQLQDAILENNPQKAVPIGRKLIENFECVREGVPDTEAADYYANIGMMEHKLNDLPHAYKCFYKARDYLTILYSKTDNKEMMIKIQSYNVIVSTILQTCQDKHIPLV
ncbi:MAG: hypothetical protein EZS28_038493 [Streblomastix strix]|uniref:SET domain-containing protein n=1 Tax=Streblomastix strix TaxID=222440 RepID=A0A5J4U7V6_9EUKA|nr:MAG: hypothetical protein EZS28_038493 [Streblomastix strix]